MQCLKKHITRYRLWGRKTAALRPEAKTSLALQEESKRQEGKDLFSVPHCRLFTSMRSITDLFLQGLSLKFLLNFSSHNRRTSGRSHIVMMCLGILQGNGKVAIVSSVHITSDTVSVCYFPDKLLTLVASLTFPLPKTSEVFFCK